MNNKILKSIFLSFVFVISSCGASFVPPTSISLNKESVDLFVDDTFLLKATVNPDNATNKNVDYTSSDNSGLSVTSSGLVTAIKAGSYTVTCSSNSTPSVKSTCSFNVSDKNVDVTQIILDKTNLDLNTGDDATLHATVKPENATDKTISWKSSDEEGLSVEASGTLHAKKAGEYVISCISLSNESVKAICNVKVSDPIIPITSISIKSGERVISSLSIKEEEIKTLSLDIKPTNATDKTVEWSSSDTSVLTVDNGVVKGVKKGKCILTVSNESSKVSSSVDVSVIENRSGTYLPSDYYGDYYPDDFSWSNGQDLKNKLSELMREKRENILNYGKAPTNWQTNQEADHSEEDFEMLDVVYDSKNIYYKDTDKKGWQREHAFCVSLMTGLLTSQAVDNDTIWIKERANDFLNLFASQNSGNQSRGNKNLGTAGVYGNVSTIGDCKYDIKNFEPSDKDKGRLSRALFYMATMYGCVTDDPLKIQEDYVSFDGKTNPAAHGNLSTMLDWANSFDVDRLEMQHNISVATSDISKKVQGNRNCYVDYPELVEYVFGDKQNESGSLINLEPALYTLDMYSNDEYYNFAIKTAKRTFKVGESFDLSADLTLVNVKKDNTYQDVSSITTDFVIDGLTSSYVFKDSDIGKHKITILPSENNKINYSKENVKVAYEIEVESADPISGCDYKHTLTSGSAKSGEFYQIRDKSGEIHTLNFDNVNFDVYWHKGTVNGVKADVGTQFGSSTVPVERLSFITTDNFDYNGNNKFNKIYVSANCASGKSYSLNIYVDEENVYSTSIIYDLNKSKTYGIDLQTPLSGKIKIEFTGINAAIYVQTIAINSIS